MGLKNKKNSYTEISYQGTYKNRSDSDTPSFSKIETNSITIQ